MRRLQIIMCVVREDDTFDETPDQKSSTLNTLGREVIGGGVWFDFPFYDGKKNQPF
jgi:hypothetical protein